MNEENRTNEKMEAGKIQLQSGFLKWLENFWYHYKWHTIVIGFFLIVLTVSLVQCSDKDDKDLMIAYAGNQAFSENTSVELSKAINAVLPEDLKFGVANYTIYTEEELNERYTYFDKEHGEYIRDLATLSGATYQNQQEIAVFSNYIKTGDCSLFFVSPYVYDLLNLSHFSKKGSRAEEVTLGQTAFYQSYDVVRDIFPEDTLIVLADSFFTKDEAFDIAEKTYNAIVDFKGN